MSKNNELEKIFEESALLEKKFQEVKVKRLELDERRVNVELTKVHQDDRDLKLAKSANFGLMNRSQVDNLIKLNDDYIEAAKNRSIFVDTAFDDVIPFFQKNIILVCGATGGGKSTTVANIVRSTIAQRNGNGDFKKVLVITNEQRAEDFYNNITCLIKGWPYTNHDKFTQEQRDEFKKYINLLAGCGLVTVVDDNFNGAMGVTKSIEGLKTIFDNLIENKQYYDVIIIDYFQNFKDSKLDPKIKDWEVQQKVAALLDTYKNIYPAPIVVMAQIQPNKDDENTPFQFRMKGAKSIGDVATLIVEIIPERDMLRTAWTIHKSRFTVGVGETFYTGYEKGSFVHYSDEFKKKALEYREKRQKTLMFKEAGITMNNKVEEKPEEENK